MDWLSTVSVSGKRKLVSFLKQHKESINKMDFSSCIKDANTYLDGGTAYQITSLLVDQCPSRVSITLSDLSETLYCVVKYLRIEELTIKDEEQNKIWINKCAIEHLIIDYMSIKWLGDCLAKLSDNKINLLSIKTNESKEECIKLIERYKNIEDFEFI